MSPLVITLAILVILQNLVVAWDNFKRRETMAPWLFTGITVGYLLFAQGLLVLSVISILVYRDILQVGVLYNAHFCNFVVTALPGLTCSKMYNVILSVTLTFNLADPFRVLDVRMIKGCIIAATGFIAFLHVSDAIVSFVEFTFFPIHLEPMNPVTAGILTDQEPGGLSIGFWYCKATKTILGRCVEGHKTTAVAFLLTEVILNNILPVITVVVCMVIQATVLSRRFSETQDLVFRRAAITILMSIYGHHHTHGVNPIRIQPHRLRCGVDHIFCHWRFF